MLEKEEGRSQDKMQENCRKIAFGRGTIVGRKEIEERNSQR